jgi:heme/copper-type cytochrome/quinol oxidase subunit 2
MYNKVMSYAKYTREALIWSLACLIFVASTSLTNGFDQVSILFGLILIVPVAVLYAVVEYRYAKFKAQPENKRWSRSLKEEFFWIVFTVIVLGTWSYFRRDEQDVLFGFQSWAFVRGFYFIIGLNFRRKQSQ